MVDRLSRYLDKRRSLAQVNWNERSKSSPINCFVLSLCKVLKVSLEYGDTVYQTPDSEFFEKQTCFEGNIKSRLTCIEEKTSRDVRIFMPHALNSHDFVMLLAHDTHGAVICHCNSDATICHSKAAQRFVAAVGILWYITVTMTAICCSNSNAVIRCCSNYTAVYKTTCGIAIYRCDSGIVMFLLKCVTDDTHDQVNRLLLFIDSICIFQYRFVDARPDEWYTKEAEMSSTQDNDNKFQVTGMWNPNFYNLSVDTDKSAVHVPTPIYKLSKNSKHANERNFFKATFFNVEPELLEEIHWSGYLLDSIFKARREKEFPAASWQFYCSKQGFMRFYPGALWNMDSGTDRGGIDLYDCRNSEWYVR